jgi:predicted RNase H-like nuclease (RuvC/YqgF family)
VADPTTLTAVIGTAAGVVGAAAGWLTARRDKARDDKDDAEERAANSVASWTALNAALDREIKRLHEEMDRLRDDSAQHLGRLRDEYEQHLSRLRDEYEQHLQAARHRISVLEAEVATLKRLLRQDSGGPG